MRQTSMAFSLNRVVVHDLFGRLSFDIPIQNNRGILIAPNGSGKSNVLQLVTFVLGRQWERVLDISFSRVLLQINGVDFEVIRENVASQLFNIQEFAATLAQFEDRDPLSVIYALAAHGILSELSRSDRGLFYGGTPSHLIEATQEALHCGPKYAEYVMDNLARCKKPPFYTTSSFVSNGDLFDNILQDFKVVYLPTYRRIEKDIRFLFNTYQGGSYGSDTSAIRRRDDTFFLELVDFGMNDVSALLKKTESAQSEFALSSAYSLSGQYLSDVVSENAQTFDREKIMSLNDRRLADMIARVRHQFADQESLAGRIRNVVERIRSDRSPRRNDKYIAHYIQLLIQTEEIIRLNEVNVTKFTNLCNRYLNGKHIFFDSIRSKFRLFTINNNRYDEVIPLSFLSSGEKQIVSLFCHLCFGSDRNLFFIDEPELSLSLDWQQRLLVDVWETGNCQFLFATTHSPFVYENAFLRNSIDLLAMRKSEGL